MNDDAVRVRQINFQAAVPSLHLLSIIPLSFSVQCFVPSLLISTLFAAFPDTFSPEASVESQGLLTEIMPPRLNGLLLDIYHLFWAGTAAGWMTPVRGLLTLLVLNFAGIAMTHAAGVQFCKERRTGALRALRHAVRQWKSALVSTALILLMGLLGLCLFRIGSWVCTRLPGITGIANFFPAALWLYAALLLLATGIMGTGWLLSAAAVGVDSCDGAEALSRGISYVLSLFWRCVCYGAIILLLAWFSKWAMTFLLNLATDVTVRSIRFPNGERFASPLFPALQDLLQEAVQLSAFFSGIAIAYVLLRQFEDNVGLRETS
jgi:hypothetical protein